jgi:tight adherence protein B
MSGPDFALALSFVGMAVCLAILIDPSLMKMGGRLSPPIARLFAADQIRVELAQAGLGDVSVAAWTVTRIGVAAISGLLTYLVFGVLVLAVVALLAVYHLIGLALEARRRRVQLKRERALLEAIRYGAALMARGGNATDMVKSLARSGPSQVRPIFGQLIQGQGELQTDFSLPASVQAMQLRLAEPLFDDLALALLLHWKRGAKLVPALEALVSDWEETLRLQRDAKAMRSGVEASVLLLTFLPLVFLLLLQLLAPALLQPFREPPGQILLGLAIAWMVLGYRVLQRMSEPPREERLRLRGDAI